VNSYDRFMIALNRGEPDRVPIAEWVISPNVIKAICPNASDQNDFEELMDLDAVCASPQFRKTREMGDGRYVDEWGVVYKPSAEVVDHPMSGPIETLADLKRYTPPDPQAPHRLGDLPKLVARYKKKKAIIFRYRAAFMWAAYLNGFENMLANFRMDPELVNALLDKVLETNLCIVRNALRAGADAVVLGDDYAGNGGPFFSPANFREFIGPRLKRMVDAIHEEGGKAIKHSDGNLWPLLDMIVETGVDAVNPIEPAAGMDIGAVKRKYGNRVCVIGNIDCSFLLSEASEEEVEAAVKDCILKASPGGGHIISSSNSIHSSVKPQNYRRMIEATRKYGTYPINIV